MTAGRGGAPRRGPRLAAGGARRHPRPVPEPLESWRDEKQSAFLYLVLAQAEAGTPREALFRGLAQAAETQAGIWAREAKRAGLVPPAFAPDLRARRPPTS